MAKKTKSGNGNFFRYFISIFLIIFAYAIIRYNVFKGVAIQYIPLYIFNKAAALAAVVLIGISYLFGRFSLFGAKTPEQKHYFAKRFGLAGFGLAAVHGMISLILFNPAYYPKFFEATGKLNLTGELSMLFGILAFAVFAIVAITSLPDVHKSLGQKAWLSMQKEGYLALVLVLLHVLVMGFSGWLTPKDWPGGLLPISLIAFIVLVFVLLAKLVAILARKTDR